MANTFKITLDRSSPVVNVENITNMFLNDLDGYRICSFDHSCNEDSSEYKIVIVQNVTDLHDNENNIAIGIVNGSENLSDSGSFPKDTIITSKIHYDDFILAVGDSDGEYTIKVFYKNNSGIWCS